MVRSAQKHGVTETARLFEVSRPTVYKWVGRFNSDGLQGLQDRSRRPHHSPHALDEKIRQQIVRLRKKMPHCGAGRLHREFGVPACSETIQKVFRQEGLTRPRTPPSAGDGASAASSGTCEPGKRPISSR